VTASDLLVEAAITAWRPRDPSGSIRRHPAWADLDAGGRRQVYEATAVARALEAGLDPEGLTTTGRAVLARIRGEAQRGIPT
jgi:hypothetical protein